MIAGTMMIADHITAAERDMMTTDGGTMTTGEDTVTMDDGTMTAIVGMGMVMEDIANLFAV